MTSPPAPAFEGFVAAFRFPEAGGSPTLDWTQAVGGTFDDWFRDVAVAPDGSILAVGFAGSIDLPTTAGAMAPTGFNDGWVARFHANGSVQALSYLGGASLTDATAVAVGPAGDVYISGLSGAFPITPGAFQSQLGGGADHFVTKIDAGLSTRSWATYVGGQAFETMVGGLVLGSAGAVYIAGGTSSQDYPATPGAFATTNSSTGGKEGVTDVDASVVEVSSDGSQLGWATYLGGASGDATSLGSSDPLGGIVLAPNGDIIVCGVTRSSDFPIQGGVQATIAGTPTSTPDGDFYPAEAYVARLSSDGSTLVASTFLGGSGDDECGGVGVDDDGNVIVSLTTSSDDLVLVSPLQNERNGIADVAVVKLTPNLDSRLFSTYLGGGGTESTTGLQVLGGRIFITGATLSNDFPVTPDATQAAIKGSNSDAFLAVLSNDGQTLAFSTYLGFDSNLGDALDRATSLAAASIP